MNFFLLLWVNFALLDLDPDSESEYESTNLIESGSYPDWIQTLAVVQYNSY